MVAFEQGPWLAADMMNQSLGHVPRIWTCFTAFGLQEGNEGWDLKMRRQAVVKMFLKRAHNEGIS